MWLKSFVLLTQEAKKEKSLKFSNTKTLSFFSVRGKAFSECVFFNIS